MTVHRCTLCNVQQHNSSDMTRVEIAPRYYPPARKVLNICGRCSAVKKEVV